MTTKTNNSSTHYAIDDYYGDGDEILGAYCGSESAIGYRTIQSEKKAFNTIGTFTYDFSDNLKLFTDIQFGTSQVKLLKRPTSWGFEDETGDDTGSFYNSFDDMGDNWYRIFTPEEMGGLKKATRTVESTTYTITPGIRGQFGSDKKWDYEVSLNASVYDSKVKFPLINFRKANALFLGEQQGIDEDTGLPIFNADPTRFYTPLTVAEYDSIAETSVYKPKSSVATFAAQVTTNELFNMPAGPVGFAAIAEVGRQNYDLGTDAKATEPYYFSWIDSQGKGHRNHSAAGVEFKVPLLEKLEAGIAARYDNFTYSGNDVGKGTYNIGLEYRPINTLLLRAAYGTGFRAPDLNYVYKGIGYVEDSSPDYYSCLSDDPTTDLGDCNSDRHQVRTSGSKELKPETSKSLNAGFVYAPSRHFDISVDYFDIKMEGIVENLEPDAILRDEAECRLGSQEANSPTCIDAISRVLRDDRGKIKTVIINPINVAEEKTNGIDINAHLRFDTPIGLLGLSGNYSYVFDHTFVRYAGDSELDKLAFDSSYYIPKEKGSFSVNLTKDKFKFNIDGNYVGRLPNYSENGWVGSYITYNASLTYDVTDAVQASLAITNLFDKKPPKDRTWTSYPYYNSSWYDGIGRAGFLQVTYKFK